MALATAAATAAVAAYLNGRYVLSNDARILWTRFSNMAYSARRAAEGRISLWYSFEEVARSAPPYLQAVWSREGNYTFKEMHSYACRYAQTFISQGIKPRESVAFFLTNSPDMILAWLGAWCAGSFPALINYNLTGEGLVHCLKLSRSKIVLVDEDSAVRQRIEDVRARIEGELGMTIVVVDAAFKLHIRQGMSTQRPDDSRRTPVKETDPSMIMFTSGTTGFPKAIPLSHKRIMESNRNRIRNIGFGHAPDARFYDCMPMYHGTGGILAMMCMTDGCTLCIGKRFRVSTFWSDIRDSQATSLVYVGETLRYLLAAPKDPRDKQHSVKIAFGNGLRPDVWVPFRDRFGIEKMAEFFSSTEGVFELNNPSRNDFAATAVGMQGLIVQAYWWRSLALARTSDENTKDLYRDPKTGFCQQMPFHVGGEVIVKVRGKTPALSGFAGYLENEKATNEKFEADVFEKGDLYYRTGDALRRDNDGRWFFLDRLGDTFRWKSENVSTAEVAEALGTYPGVNEANVYGVLVPGHDGRAGCAAVYLADSTKGGTSFNWKGLVTHLRQKLPKYAVPVFIRVLDGEMKAGMHNMKQNKVELRKEGCEMDKITKAGDRMFYLPPGTDEYVDYQRDQWLGLSNGSLKL